MLHSSKFFPRVAGGFEISSMPTTSTRHKTPLCIANVKLEYYPYYAFYYIILYIILLQTVTKTLYAAEVEPIAVVAVVRPRRAVHILKRWLGAVVAHVHPPH